jgi:hypothetical protein
VRELLALRSEAEAQGQGLAVLSVWRNAEQGQGLQPVHARPDAAGGESEMELIYIAEAIIILPLILVLAAWVMDR